MSSEGAVMLDQMYEDALVVIIESYDGNEDYAVSGSYDVFPKYMQFSYTDIFTQLKSSGLIASYLPVLSGWSCYLTPSALTYFKKKEERSKVEMPMFNKLPTNSRSLLREIVDSDNVVDMLQHKFAECENLKQDNELRSLIKELQQEGYISVPHWADNVPYCVEISNSARTYDEKEAEYERRLATPSNNTTNNFFGDTSNIQIQQNTSNSSQNMNIWESVDYEKALELFNHVLANLDSFNLPNEDRVLLEKTATEAKSKVETKTSGVIVRKSLSVIKDIMLRASGSLAAQGILYGLQQMGAVQ